MRDTSAINAEQAILDILRDHPVGIKISDIEVQLAEPIPRRTLLRRLTALEKEGKIAITGQKSAVRYFPAPADTLIKLSSTGQKLKASVNRPIQQRKPVGYNLNFLYDYEPNETYYLSEKIRKQLNMTGRVFNQPLQPGTFAKRILDRLLVDLSWNSSRLEGNTYSLLETERLIEYGAEAEGKNTFEAQMIINHKEAIEFMVEHVDKSGINNHIVLNLHALLSNNLLKNPKARGQLRKIPVGIAKTVYHPLEVPQTIEQCFNDLLKKANMINDPFEQAFFISVHLPYLQPFEDVNKRVSRLAANIPLIKNNLSPLSFIDVPEDDYISGLLAVYELNSIELIRDVFVWAYERSAQQYQAMQNTLSSPNLTHLQFKKELTEVVQHIVNNNIKGANIIDTIRTWTKKHIPNKQQKEFAHIAEREIASLHPGNIAVHKLNPSAYEKWRAK